jgi:hypothetical protein
MPTRKTHKQDNPEQSKRFVDMAREVGVDENPSAFDHAFDRVIHPEREPIPTDSRVHKRGAPNT